MRDALPYPPPWQDAATLCSHLCISESTIDNWIRQGVLPPAKMRGGKRMWKWSEVERFMEGDGSIVPESDIRQEVFNATKRAAAHSR
jgi:predicted site-specific integrase-resolvase